MSGWLPKATSLMLALGVLGGCATPRGRIVMYEDPDTGLRHFAPEVLDQRTEILEYPTAEQPLLRVQVTSEPKREGLQPVMVQYSEWSSVGNEIADYIGLGVTLGAGPAIDLLYALGGMGADREVVLINFSGQGEGFQTRVVDSSKGKYRIADASLQYHPGQDYEPPSYWQEVLAWWGWLAPWSPRMTTAVPANYFQNYKSRELSGGFADVKPVWQEEVVQRFDPLTGPRPMVGCPVSVSVGALTYRAETDATGVCAFDLGKALYKAGEPRDVLLEIAGMAPTKRRLRVTPGLATAEVRVEEPPTGEKRVGLVPTWATNRPRPASPSPVASSPSCAPPPGRTLALLVGVSRYADSSISSLDYTRNDVAALRKALLDSKTGRVRSQDLIVLTDDQASPESIREALSTLQSRVQPADQLLFFFAGHGLRREGATDWWMLLANSTIDTQGTPAGALSVAEFTEWINGIACRDKVLIFDACYSGFRRGQRAGWRAIGPPAREQLTEGFQPGQAGLAVLTSTISSTPAVELPELKNGLYTHHLVQGMGARFSEADENRDGCLTVREAQLYAITQMRRYCERHKLAVQEGDMNFVGLGSEAIIASRR